ncbi:MAG TPA: MBL fold metallo-hydrolase [Burkholderiaceae bacterium]|nr:MBL fold metallo-hydrolase [Burkholderiaceae bacterium]
MNRNPRSVATLVGVLLVSLLFMGGTTGVPSPSPADPQATDRPELAYLKQVNAWHPPSDPQLLFLLMQQYANSGRHLEGASYIDELRRRFDGQLDDTQRALYLTAIASLRAGGASQVIVFKRIGWMRDTLAMLDEAQRLTHGEAFITHWMSGIVRSEMPGFFGERATAEAELRWCLQHADKLPHPGWLREVHFHLARLLRDQGDAAQSQRELAASGFTSYDKPVLFTTPFVEDRNAGHAFSARSVRELVPGSVYGVSGYEFTEYYFVVSADRRELIAIDAGSRADAARQAHEALRARIGNLPPLTTVLITHAHWDHVGGQAYFRSLNPAPRFMGRGNYAQELEQDAQANPAGLRNFFGKDFRMEDVLSYRPDVSIDRRTELTIGGTRLELLPTRGGETSDAMLIRMPDQGVVFVGDILMPYFGAPFVEEGSPEGMLAAIEQVSALKPRLLLHGHEPLTRVFDSTGMLDDLRVQLAWLREAVLREMARGTGRGAIQQANLVPPTLARSPSSVHLAYLLMRENMINRLYDQHSGYWQNGLQGLDVLTDADHGAALVDYLGLGESQVAAAAERMIADGRHELAAQTLRWARTRLPRSERLDALNRLAYLKLVEKYQDFNPFKVIVYAGEIDQAIAPMAAPAP